MAQKYVFFQEGNLRGIKNRDGHVILPAKYEAFDMYLVYQGMVCVRMQNKWGFVDTLGKQLIACKYDTLRRLTSSMVIYGKIDRSNNKILWGLVGIPENEITKAKYTDIRMIEGMITARDNNEKIWILDEKGKERITEPYDWIGLLKDGAMLIRKRDKMGKDSYGFMDRSGKMITPIHYDEAYDFSNGRAYVKKDNKAGYIDRSGKEVIPLKYAKGTAFSLGLASVTVESAPGDTDESWGFIDTMGKYVISPQYERAYPFSAETKVAMALLNKKWGLIDMRGKVVIPYEYSFDEAKKISRGKNELEVAIKKHTKPLSVNEAREVYNKGVLAYRKKDYAKAFDHWMEAAEKGNQPEAMYQIGMLYANGEGVKQDITIAEEWLKKALAKNISWAKEPLDEIMKFRNNGNDDLTSAVNAYEKADYAKALHHLQIAAEKGNTEAMVSLGLMYKKGEGTTIQKSKAIYWWEQAAAKEADSAYIHLGAIYYEGAIGIPKDYKKSMEWYQKAAQKNNPQAFFMIGNMYEKGLGVRPNKTEAIQWYRKSAEKGHKEAKQAVTRLE